MVRRLIVFIALLEVLLPVHPASATPRFQISLSQKKITLDESLLYQLLVEWPKSEANYSFALPEIPLKNFSILRQGESQESVVKAGEEWSRKTFTMELKPVQPGDATIKAFDLPYIDTASQKGGAFSIPEQKIRIAKSPMAVSAIIKIIAGFTLLAFIIGILGWMLRKKHAAAAPELATQSREDMAAQKIKSLTEGAAAKSKKDLLHEMTAELRRFVADYYQLQSMPAVESELIETLRQKNKSREEIDSLKRLLDQLHEAKFAGMAISDSDFSRLQRDIVQYIESKRVLGTP